MCKYCQGNHNQYENMYTRVIENHPDVDEYQPKEEAYMYMYYSGDDMYLQAEAHRDDGTTIMIARKVNYCPMCGRKV